ncbi:MAG: bifunctional proline dehydrogenase/L-glutamate gamma-semialdehyde dehydrogenase PutA [Pseudomonadales bacterium]|nr:bifunctional proline dehydrogenase/L-glutamate gamma-semialdehyde dehydrogenase PutA [Pseudomonadales bacterium]
MARCKAPSTMGLEFPLQDSILNNYLRNEEEAVQELLMGYGLDQQGKDTVRAYAMDFLGAIRNAKPGIRVETLLKEYGLDNREGITLMCLAEALLRIPDQETAERFLQDRLRQGNWAEHLGHSDARWVNASTWGLLITGKLLNKEEFSGNWLSDGFKGLFRRLGEPLALSAVKQAMMVIGQQFVAGQTIEEAIQRSKTEAEKGYYHSYDMLGEAALCENDAQRFQDAYEHAIEHLSESLETRKDHGGISIKLSALHPRFELKQSRNLDQIYDRLMDLLLLAQEKDIAVTIDAEESWRLEPTLLIFSRAISHNRLRHWGKLGLAVQAYQKRAPALIQWLMDLSKSLHCQIPVRLVKGAYWDTEIKQAQQLGLEEYPVFTQKDHTDLCFLYCAQTLLSSRHFLYPQFATHNAHTVASILTLAEQNRAKHFEFQRLHGMGESLYNHVLENIEDARCRIYAPVGEFSQLLPYLVRRLLENGANTSFVRQIQLAKSDGLWLIDEPNDNIKAMERLRNPRIPLPRRVFYPERKNSRGLNLESINTLQKLSKSMQEMLKQPQAVESEATQGLTPIYNPATPGEVVGLYKEATRQDCLQAFDNSREAWKTWRYSNADDRANLLDITAKLFEENSHELMLLTMREAGKTLMNALGEVREAVDFLRYYANQARILFEPKELPSITGEENRLLLEGKGPVLCISPWNFPLAIFTGQVSAALAAGNTVLAKPSTLTPLVARRAIELFHEAGFPKNTVQLLPAKAKTIEDNILKESALRAVMFTGSTSAAKRINRKIGERDGPIIPLIAETGGQNAMIVDSSALTEQVVRDIVQSAFDSAGQRCSALRILFIQEDVKNKTLDTLKGYIDTFQVGDPLDWETDIGPVIDSQSRNDLMRHIDHFRNNGRILYEGKRPEDSTTTQEQMGHFVPPTIIELQDLSELHEEVFGPVLHVITFAADKVNNIIDQINRTGFGLTLGVHSRINGFCENVAKRAQVGNIYVNRNIIGATVGSQPFGGQDLSGTGPKAGGPHYLLRLANEKTISINTAAVGGNTKLLTDD